MKTHGNDKVLIRRNSDTNLRMDVSDDENKVLNGSGSGSGSNSDSMPERDYDVNPTPLYSLLQSRSWEQVVDRIDAHPDECKSWIYRKENGSVKLRWRLLPLHAAIIFKAPVEVIESILTGFPDAAKFPDDQSALPIHLAYKRGASASTYRVLLESFPSCVNVKDAKGRTPRRLARSGSGPRHVEFVYAFKVHMAGRRVAREEARAIEEKVFNGKLQSVKESHEAELKETKIQNEKNIVQLERKIENLEKDVETSRTMSKMLNDTIAELQSQLKGHLETEGLLAKQLVEMNSEMCQSRWTTPSSEEKRESELLRLNDQIAEMKEQVNKLLLEKEILNKSLEAVVDQTEWEKRKLEKKVEEQRETIDSLRESARKAETEKETLELVLQEKTDKEKELSETIGTLETKLQTRKASESGIAAYQMHSLETERDSLKESNKLKTSQLGSVATFLDEMRGDQFAIVKQAEEHEQEMDVIAKEHDRILAEMEEQRERDAKAAENRQLLTGLMQAEELEMAHNVKLRGMIQEALSLQTQRLETAFSKRESLVGASKNVSSLLEKKLEGVRTVISAEEESITGKGSSPQDLATTSPSSFESRETMSDDH